MKYEKEYTVRLPEDEEKTVEFISRKLASGKRIHELEMLKLLLESGQGHPPRQDILKTLAERLHAAYGITMDALTARNVINVMTNEFPAGSGKKTYDVCVFLEPAEPAAAENREPQLSMSAAPAELKQHIWDGSDAGQTAETDIPDYEISEKFAKMLENPEFRDIVEELVEFGISRYQANFSSRYQDTSFVLYQKYTYEDVCRLLNWENNEVPLNIGGYKYDRKTKTFPVFINYVKADDVTDTTRYEDRFVSESTLIAISKSGRSGTSEDVQNFLHAKERGIDVHLLIRKNKDDKISKEFYYLGRMQASGKIQEFQMPNTTKTAVEIEWILDTPVREDIYQYLIG